MSAERATCYHPGLQVPSNAAARGAGDHAECDIAAGSASRLRFTVVKGRACTFAAAVQTRLQLPFQRAVIAWSHAYGGLELTGERALVSEAAALTDAGNAVIAMQLAHRRFDPQFGQ